MKCGSFIFRIFFFFAITTFNPDTCSVQWLVGKASSCQFAAVSIHLEGETAVISEFSWLCTNNSLADGVGYTRRLTVWFNESSVSHFCTIDVLGGSF